MKTLPHVIRHAMAEHEYQRSARRADLIGRRMQYTDLICTDAGAVADLKLRLAGAQSNMHRCFADLVAVEGPHRGETDEQHRDRIAVINIYAARAERAAATLRRNGAKAAA